MSPTTHLSTTAFLEEFQADDAALAWDTEVYGAGSYETAVWQLQAVYIRRLVQALAAGQPGLTVLDFACGTGRVLAVIAPYAATATGVDIAPQMLTAARSKAPQAALIAGDILAEPGLIGGDFDLITAFRFFLNAPAPLRAAILASLAHRLRDERSLLVFNIHGNATSVLGLRALIARFSGRACAATLRRSEVARLVGDVGLEIVEWSGFGLCPRALYHTRLRPLVEAIDRWAARRRRLRGISRDLVFVCRRRGREADQRGETPPT